MSDVIPDNLPYRTFPCDWVDEQPTWYQYITGQFNGEIWWERDEIDTSNIDPMQYQPVPFDEELNHLHEQFLIHVRASRIKPDMCEPGCLEIEWQDADGPLFTYDVQCRFDIWTLYNQSGKKVELDIGGTARIKTLPIQSEISDVPPLQDTVPSDVPLICGPQLHTPVGEPSIPARPFGKSTLQISNSTDMQEQYWQQLPGNH